MDLKSLRNRYAIVSIISGCLVLIAAITTDYYLIHTRTQTTTNIENRNTMLARSRVIRNTVWQVREAISHFLMNPERTENQERIFIALGEALNGTERIIANQTILTKAQLEQIQKIAPLLQKLESSTNELIKIRLDSYRQYPGLSLAQSELLPRQKIIFTAFSLALEESVETVTDGEPNLEIYRLLVDARHRWSTTISTFRLLLASRVGSFGSGYVKYYILEIEQNIQSINQKLNRLQELQNSNAMDLATNAAIDAISENLTEWKSIYSRFLKRVSDNEWRGDIQKMRVDIDPVLEILWLELFHFDVLLETGAVHDVKTITSVAQNQSYLIWSLGIATLMMIIVGFFSLNRFVLSPMATLARALFKEASGGEISAIPKSNSTETKNLIIAFSEMRNKIRNRQNALEYQAMHDTLTGLANRALLYKKLTELTVNLERKNDVHSLILMDLDRFKEVNDTLGHQVGDKLLVSISARLSELLRETDTIARLGGDEFAIILPETDKEEAKTVSEKILREFEKPFKIDEYELYIGASLGIAVYPFMAVDVDSLLKRSDVAMYVAKRNRLGFTFYEAANDLTDSNYLSIASDMRTAFNKKSFSLHYQLKYDIDSDMAIGVEALLRWFHPDQGEISPDKIIPIAEQIGIINRLTLWVLDTALQQCQIWREQGIYLSVAVNMSVYDLRSAEIVDQIDALLCKHDIPPSYLIVEVTEGAMLIDPACTIEVLKRLDEKGIRIAIDDFGTGFSSLAYLKRLPVGELKIDKSFVMDMVMNENDEVIVRSTIELAHNLGIQVVAEGVETQEIYSCLNTLSCDIAQGFYMCKPVAAEEVLNYLYIGTQKEAIQ